MSSSNCCFLTWIQISQEAGKVVWYFHPLKNFPQFIVIHTAKGIVIVNKAEVDVFMELFFFVYDPTDVGNLIFGYSAFSKSSLNIWKFSVHVLWKPNLENFDHCLASVWNECKCVVVYAFFGIAFIWDWTAKRSNQSILKEISPEYSLKGLMLSFQICWHIECKILTASFFRIWNNTTGIPSPPSIVLQALCLSNLIPWIYLSLPLYNCKEFDLGYTWLVSWFSLFSSI